MKFSFAAIVALVCSALAAEYCDNCTNESTEPIVPAPAPWLLKGHAYAVPIIAPAPWLPEKTYSPLERASNYTQGTFVGVAGFILLVRYTETPVGPYDEFIVVPGFYSYLKKGLPQLRIRIGRIYVSQKYTTWNGRHST